MNNRRNLLIVLGSAPFTPQTLFAQSKTKVWRIGFIGQVRYFTIFRDELVRLGYIDGKTIDVDFQLLASRADRIPAQVEDLIKSRVDLLVLRSVVATRAAQRATSTIPIVMVTTIDPVAEGFAQSLRRPGGNITGIYSLRDELSAKRVELLRELLPGISRVAIVWDPDFPAPRQRFSEYLAAAKTLNLEIQSLEVKAPMPDLESAFQAARSNRSQALIIIASPSISKLRKSIMALAARDALPVVAENSAYVRDGALISYAGDVVDEAKILASIVARILKGAKPAELPIEQPTRFELVVNLKAAKTLGLTVPPEIMVQATRVIQ